MQDTTLKYAKHAESIQICINFRLPTKFKLDPKILSNIDKKKKITLWIRINCKDRFLLAMKMLNKKNIYKLKFEETIKIGSMGCKPLKEYKPMFDSIRNLNIKELDISIIKRKEFTHYKVKNLTKKKREQI